MLVASCGSPAAPVVDPVPTAVEAPAVVTAEPATEVPTPQTTLPPTAGPTPTVRPGMEASDPTTVVLAGGDPTLVEFFAFW